MLPGMFRALGIALMVISAGCAGCGKSAAPQAKKETASNDEVISVPGGKGGGPSGPGQIQAAGSDAVATGAPGNAAPPNPAFFLKPEEGTLTVDKAEGKAGAETTANIKVLPATGYHVSTDFPIKLTLDGTPGVTLEKSEMTAGGRDKKQGDASALSEKGLEFAVKAKADKAGSYTINGILKFGICEKESCHPKKQPITITVAAN